MEVIPAIDLRLGLCVRLFQGDYQQETVFSDEPVSVALAWQEQGAPRLHLVDLDGAAGGVPVNLEVITSIIHNLTIPVQIGGGIRDLATAESLLSAGADRVVIGTAAVENPSLVEDLCQKHGSQRVVIAVDAKDGLVAIKGWLESTEVKAQDLVEQMALLGVRRILYTDISRDGTLTEPNFEANADLVRTTDMAVLASGGIATLDHVRRLVDTGAEGAILGRALYTEAFSLREAIAVAE
ncbi:MAG TPA: 1-(5-phosphoribosyl)-5-((5-phosphoribosylamino)methylideneamino)imidazole-4-carboxamide isomerase [Dehalococcoidia bacterium]|nr:1-(5-phosphoribosyl)-5-[(5-phosphoribosylamino)methylideneamino]imidazole-4-carboxamide isomerase [Chloroflexota bacterium]HAJ00558.1 1-(5-phosphoribosyl)-5-((5-phosphoribosylamino)methylideneamino)imidazole-4-carboxamide isomerase [Dehalococcoidia bacterium]